MHNRNKAIALIKKYEGFRANAYRLAGETYYTIGYGESNASINKNSKTTEAEASVFISRRLEELTKSLSKIVKVDLNENQYNALLSFIYNIGITAFTQSTILKRINSSEFDLASKEFDRWVKGADGKPISGLVIRRKEEKQLFIS